MKIARQKNWRNKSLVQFSLIHYEYKYTKANLTFLIDTLKGLRIEFRHMRTYIPNKTSIPKHPRLNGKQRFMGKESLKQSDPKSIACSGVVTPLDLHCRLGHLSLLLSKKLYPQFSSLSSLNCESCQYAKLHRVTQFKTEEGIRLIKKQAVETTSTQKCLGKCI